MRHGAVALAVLCCLAGCSTTADEPEVDAGASTDETGGGTDADSSSGPGGPTTDASSTSSSTSTTSGDPSTTGGSDDSSTGSDAGPGPDFRELGPYTVSTQTGEQALPTNCTMGYTTYAPQGVDDAPVVFLAHGFQGNRGSMVGWAEHWASWGLTVITPDLCHSTILDAQHTKNGTDMVALRDALALGPVLWAGHSAGGNSSVAAAAADTMSLGVLGLDAVDREGEGLAAAPQVTGPGYLIAGEAGQCNSSGNAVGMFAAMPEHRIVRLIEADHCDFQSPTDPLCGVCNQGNSANTPEEINAAVLGLSTAFLLWRAGVDATGQQWWTAGQGYYEELVAAGLLDDLL